MIRAVENTINYFKAPENYFWRWGENLEAIEWISGAGTICFKDDLALILKQFPGGKLPRLGALLLVLSAFNHPVKGRSKIVLCQLFGIQRVSEEKEVFDFLERINSLPPSLRSGDKRLRLLRELFGEADPVQETFEASIIELQSGRIDNELMMAGPLITDEFFQADLQALKETALRFETVQRLDLFLNTGVESLPEPPSIEIPDEKHFDDLFDQLLEDPQTAGMARLARRLLSIIHIPIHARAGGEDSYGGIADITNRGNYDRLLLSELAQDELLLTARLVNNEALYFRREEPPAEPRNRRILLIDSTIKMWGVPRVFAIAAALAFSRNSKHGEKIETYVLKETTYEQISLEDKEGVINALTQLHPALHPGRALEAAVRELNSGEETEFILITEDRQLKHAGFYADFFKVKERISFAITVDRDGDIRFAEYNNGHAKVLNEAKLDIDELLTVKEIKLPVRFKKQKKADTIERGEFRFLYRFPLPLLFPKRNILLDKRFVKKTVDGYAIVIDRAKRVLMLKSGLKGSVELMASIEHGVYEIEDAEPLVFQILVRCNEGPPVLKLYTIDINQGRPEEENLLPVITGKVSDASFADDGFLYLFSGFVVYKYDCQVMKLIEEKRYSSLEEVEDVKYSLQKVEKGDTGRLHSLMKSPNYQILYKATDVYVNSKDELVWGNFSLKLDEPSKKLMFADRPNPHRLVTAKLSEETFFTGTKVKCRKAEFPDGSVMLMDKRGVLHLKSADKNLPEVAIITITHRPTAAWSSADTYCGARFFIEVEDDRSIVPEDQFYNQYITPFINQILNHGTSPEI